VDLFYQKLCLLYIRTAPAFDGQGELTNQTISERALTQSCKTNRFLGLSNFNACTDWKLCASATIAPQHSRTSGALKHFHRDK
jgi:hypothetical protein